MAYFEKPDDDDDIYTVEQFREHVKEGSFIDYDGYGHPMKDGLIDPNEHVYPSKVSNIPPEATHVVWYNR